MDNYSNDFVNQITLNCLISKSQLMKINNTKIKKNLNVERNKKIKKYHSQLVKLFEELLNKNEPSDLFDDVKSSYVHFIDKTIIYLDSIDANTNDENIINENIIEKKNNSTEEKNNSTKEKNNSTEEKNNLTEEKNNSTEEKNNSTEEKKYLLNENNLLNKKINDMMNRCYDDRYYEMMLEEESLKEIYDDQNENQNEDEDEDDEEDEY